MHTQINLSATTAFNESNYLINPVDYELDTQGLSCPLPILKTKKALANMLSGQIVRITSTDAGAVRDFQIFTKQTGHTLLGQYMHGAICVHIVQRK
jgi:TusA-related sulfurtransferase